MTWFYLTAAERTIMNMGKRILLGDRKSLARMAYKGTLEAAGYEVVGVATNGMDLKKLYEEQKPDLVLSSAALGEPGGNVLTVLRLLLDGDPNAVVLLYAGSGVCSEEECLNAGAKGFFEYPARPDEMLSAVKRLIG